MVLALQNQEHVAIPKFKKGSISGFASILNPLGSWALCVLLINGIEIFQVLEAFSFPKLAVASEYQPRT